MADAGQVTWLPRIARRMTAVMPRAHLRVVGIDSLISLGDLASAEIDLHIGLRATGAAHSATNARTVRPRAGACFTLRVAAAIRATVSSCMIFASSSCPTLKPVEESHHLPSASRNRIQSFLPRV